MEKVKHIVGLIIVFGGFLAAGVYTCWTVLKDATFTGIIAAVILIIVSIVACSINSGN